MTAEFHDALLDGARLGRPVHLADLGDPVDLGPEVAAAARTPLAPLAAEALTATAAEPAWIPVAITFTQQLADQTSQLALTDTVDTLLDDPTLAPAVASTLHTAMLSDHHRWKTSRPYLAATRLESALRITLAGAVPPYLALHHLAEPGDDPDAYREALPRLIGIALDRWAGDGALTDPLLTRLRRLAEHPDTAASARHEMASHRLRHALRQPLPAALDELSATAAEFRAAAQADEARDDSAAYAAVCTAVSSFADGDLHELAETVDHLDPIMQRRVAWHHGTHQPRWRRHLLEAEIEWWGLVIDLREAAARLVESSWLDAAAAVGQLARVYASDRATAPAPGLSRLVRPAIENAITARAVLADQLHRAVSADRARPRPLLPASADLLHAAIQQHRDDPPTASADPAGARPHDRLQQFAPGLLDLLGPALAEQVADGCDDTQLSEIGLVVHAASTTGITQHPALSRMRSDIVSSLAANPEFRGETRILVVALLDATLTFLLDRYDRQGPLIPGVADYRRPIAKGDSAPGESHLQYDFVIWLASSAQFAGRVTPEISNIATGRADVHLRRGDIRLLTEIKRELDDASRAAVTAQYSAQAAAYSGSNVPFSQLLVLDLTDHTAGVPSLRDLAWVIEHQPTPGATPRHVVAALVIGNRPPPSALHNRPA